MRIKRLGWIGAKGAAAHCAGSELTAASGGAVAELRRRRPSGARFGSGLGRGASSRRGELVGGASAGRRGDGGQVRQRRDEAKLQRDIARARRRERKGKRACSVPHLDAKLQEDLNSTRARRTDGATRSSELPAMAAAETRVSRVKAAAEAW